MSSHTDSPTVPTFPHTRKLSSASSTLPTIAEKPQARLLNHRDKFLHSPTILSPKTARWSRYNAFLYGPSVASQHVFTHTVTTPVIEKCPSILSLDLLGAESDEESGYDGDDSDWNEGWDVSSVHEMTWDSCELPRIHENDFLYYPREECAHVSSRFSDDSEDETVEGAEVVEMTVTPIVKAKDEKKGFGQWMKEILRKLKGRN
jgi:hypothetical protein